MKANSLYTLCIILSIIILLCSGQIKAEERNIYVGDLITIKVSSGSYNIDELQKKFSDFEIVGSKEFGEGGYQLTLRTFEPGEYNITLGDKNVEIVVKSTLEDIERDSIFAADPTPLKSYYNPGWLYLFCALIIVFIIIMGNFIRLYIKNKRKKNESFYQRFKRKLAAVEISEKDFFVLLTFIFKEYLEDTYNCQIRGKSSSEIMDEVRDIPDLEAKHKEIRKWLRLADYYKYTRVQSNAEVKERQRTELMELTAGIEETIQVNGG